MLLYDAKAESGPDVNIKPPFIRDSECKQPHVTVTTVHLSSVCFPGASPPYGYKNGWAGEWNRIPTAWGRL